MKYRNLLFFCLLTGMIAGCSTDSGELNDFSISGDFEHLNVTEQEIFNIDVQESNLFAGTSDGLMVFDLFSGERTGYHKPESSVRAFLIIDEECWLISTAYPDGSQENAIFKSENQGESWIPYTNGYAEGWEGERRLTPDMMDYHADSNQPVIFARTLPVLFVAKSTDGGASWENVFDNWDNPSLGASRFIKIDKNNSNIIWAGGSNTIFNPYLIKSENGGEDWEFVDILPNSENNVYNVTIRHQRSNHILASVGGGILKSTDSGKNWEIVHSGVTVRTFVKSSQDPNIIFASGINTSGTLFLLASNNYGETWVVQKFYEGPTELYVNDMVSVTEENNEVLYMGTNKGVVTFAIEN